MNFDSDLEFSPQSSPSRWGTAITASVLFGGAFAAHTQALKYSSGYGPALHRFFTRAEDLSPAHLLRTFSLSERLSSYTVDSLHIPYSDLVRSGGRPTDLGAHLHRLIGDRVDVFGQLEGLSFTAQPGSPYLGLDSHPGVGVRFVERPTRLGVENAAGARLAGSSARYDAPLAPEKIAWSTASDRFTRWKENLQAIRHSQHPKGYGQAIETADKRAFQPYLAEVQGRSLYRSFEQKAGRVGFDLAERLQRLMADVGLGLSNRSYNKLFHLPFAPGELGKGGFINKLLTHRVLPIALAFGVALPYLDYKTGHVISGTAIDAYQKASVFHSELTDRLPGVRRVTDFYAQAVPGSQYGPLALPVLGGTVGALAHYAKVLSGQYATEKARTAGLRRFSKWGLVAGAAAMLPFIPGMLGSRQTADEKRRIFSGEQDVPIRSGRWWDMGCQLPDNQQVTSSGIRTASSIYAEKLDILNGAGRLETPSAWLRYHYRNGIVRLRVAGQPVEQSFTVNHPIPVWRDGVVRTVRADEASVGDLVLMTRLQPTREDTELDLGKILPHLLLRENRLWRKQINWPTGDFQRSGKWSIPATLILDYEMGLLFGHYLAEGNLNSSRGRNLRGVDHVGSLDELGFLLDLKDIYQRRFGVTATLYKDERKCYRLRTTAGTVADLFAVLFHPQTTRDKKIGFQLLQLGSADFLKGLLEGWFYGDGTFAHNNGRTTSGRIKTKHLENVVALQKVLSAFGAAGLINRYEQTFAVDYPDKSLAGKTFSGYMIAFSTDSLASLSMAGVGLRKGGREPWDGYSSPSGSRRYLVSDRWVGFEVLGIVHEEYDGWVYDFTIDSDHHYEVLSYVTHNSSAFEGNRIKEWRKHWSVLFRTQAEKKSLYGSEEEYWAQNPWLHPIKYLQDPYALEKLHYEDRPYPITSPAFSNVPLIGPILAATIGKLVKPPVYMHREEWDQKDYSLYSTRLEPRGPGALPPPTPTPEFSLGSIPGKEATIAYEFIGLPGFIAKSIYDKVFPDTTKGQQVNLQGSRQMENFSRRYYEMELGAGLGPGMGGGAFGYSEPFRRFVQREQGIAQANEIPNQMPSWIPGDDYFLNMRVGDPYIKVSNGYARLPGAGYEALHPELAGLDAEDYPDLAKLSILGDVAPYSKEFAIVRGRLGKEVSHNTELAVEYEKILDQVRQTKQSVIRSDERRFSGEVQEVLGTVTSSSSKGTALEEYPGRFFQISSVNSSAAKLSALILGEHNDYTRAQVAAEVDQRQARRSTFLNDQLSTGVRVRLTVPAGSLQHAEAINAVMEIDGMNLNQALIEQGLGVYDREQAGPETQAMFSPSERLLASYAEQLSFTGDEAWWNPLRYLPSPGHTKLWQERTPLAQYLDQEVIGTRMRRWQRPLHDFLAPYARGIVRRLGGVIDIPETTTKRRDLNTMVDTLNYLRDLELASEQPEDRGRYTSQASRTATGANLFGSPLYVGSTLPDRESNYFQRFLPVTDPKERAKILASVPQETARALAAQWAATDASIARAQGEDAPAIGEGGRLYTRAGLEAYKQATTQLDYGDFQRSQEIAAFFAKTGLRLPGPESSLWDPSIDYEDVKLKIIQQEGYDAHDFNVFDDRAALLWRKPYIDGAVRELTSGGSRAADKIRMTVEQIMLASRNRNSLPVVAAQSAAMDRGKVTLNVDLDQQDALLKDMHRNPENYD